MKNFLMMSGLVFFVAQGALADVTGNWLSEKNDKGASISVNVYVCGKAVCGKVTEVHNSENQSSVGKEMIKGMTTPNGVDFSNGQIFAPDTNKWYQAKMKLVDEKHLKVSGCVLGGVICRSQTWTRQ